MQKRIGSQTFIANNLHLIIKCYISEVSKLFRRGSTIHLWLVEKQNVCFTFHCNVLYRIYLYYSCGSFLNTFELRATLWESLPSSDTIMCTLWSTVTNYDYLLFAFAFVPTYNKIHSLFEQCFILPNKCIRIVKELKINLNCLKHASVKLWFKGQVYSTYRSLSDLVNNFPFAHI